MTGEGTPVPVHFNICNGGERKLIDGFVVKEDYLSSSPRRTPLCPHWWSRYVQAVCLVEVTYVSLMIAIHDSSEVVSLYKLGVIRYKYPRWWILCDMIPMTRLATISICQIICDTNIKFSCLWPLLHTFSSYFFMWDIFVTWSKYFPFFRFCSQETNECIAMLSWECSNTYIRISAWDILHKINVQLSNNTYICSSWHSQYKL